MERSPYTNHYGETFWRTTIPEEFTVGTVEMNIRATKEGIEVGNGVIPWREIDDAREVHGRKS